jgi:hypothetical protein
VGREHRPPPDPRERKGFMMSFASKPGSVVFPNGFVPYMRAGFQIGGGITDRFTLGAELSGTGYFGHKKGSFGGDLVGTGFLWRGLYLRTGLGAHSGLPSSAHDYRLVPAIGGLVGLGYEFLLHEHIGLALGGEYDARVLTTGGFRQSASLGLRIAVYLGSIDR